MMKGFVRSNHNLNISQRRVSEAMKRVSPNYHQARVNRTGRQTNPIPYRSDYFGHKVHMDQNEKLVMYGVTHVAAIDGHSRYIVGAVTMAIKNNLIIYEKIYKYVRIFI